MDEGGNYLFVVTVCTNDFYAAPYFVFKDGAPQLFSPSPFEVFEDDPNEDKGTTAPPAVDESFIIDWD